MPSSASNTGFGYDNLGRLIRIGKTVRTRDWQVWDDTAMPSWLSSLAGAVSVTPMGLAEAGRCRMTATTGTAANCSIYSAGLDPTQFQEMAIYVDDLKFNTDDPNQVSFQIGFGAPDVNFAGYNHIKTGATVAGYFANSATNKEIQYSHTAFFDGGTVARQRSLGVIFRPIEQAVYLVGNDHQVLWKAKSTQPANYPTAGLLTPRLNVYNSAGVAAWFQFSRIRVEVVTG